MAGETPPPERHGETPAETGGARREAGGEAARSTASGASNGPSNGTRFLLLCALCALLTGAYAWFSLAGSDERTRRSGLPSISGSLDAAPVGPAPASPAGQPAPGTVPADTNVAAETLAERAAEATPAGLPQAGGGADSGTAREGAMVVERLPDAGAGAPADNAGTVAGSGSREHAAPAPARRFLVRHTGLDRSHGFLAVETELTGTRTREATPLMCHRLHFAAGHGSCLMVERDFFTTYTAVLFDAAFSPRHRVPLNGIPSRTRVSPDGRHAAITVFVSGHSYADSLFSTETSIVDTGTGALVVANMEELPVFRDGQRFHSLDFNFWGVTFAADGDRFFATLGTGGTMYLVEGNLAERAIRVVKDGIECPALSPDETRVAFKKRMPGGGKAHWRPHVLDLETLEETALAESRSVDDQVEWLDDEHILYGLPQETGSPTAHVWVLPADGSGEPELFLGEASSPTVLRGGATVTGAIVTEG